MKSHLELKLGLLQMMFKQPSTRLLKQEQNYMLHRKKNLGGKWLDMLGI
jgi:hypothetical protein